MVPVTTKPYFNSFNFIILLQGVPAFFLLIKKTISQYFVCRENNNHGCNAFCFAGLFLFRFELHFIRSITALRAWYNSSSKLPYTLFLKLGSHYQRESRSLCFGDIPIHHDERDNSTCASIFASLDFGEFHWFPIPISELDSSTYKFHCAMLTKFESHYD